MQTSEPDYPAGGPPAPLSRIAPLDRTVAAGWLVCALIAIASIAAAVALPKSLLSDPGWGLLATEQHRAGITSSILAMRQADPRDLTRDVDVPVRFWAPAYQALPFAFLSLGVSLGAALKLVVVLAWSIMVLGWGAYFRRILVPKPAESASSSTAPALRGGASNSTAPALRGGAVLPWLLAAFMLFRFTHANFWAYDGGEYLLLAFFPLLVLLHVDALAREWSPVTAALCALAGYGAVLIYLIKYSGLLCSFGLCVGWGVLWLMKRAPFRKLIALAAGAAAGLATLGAAGALSSSGTPLLYGFERQPLEMIWNFFAAPLAVSDIFGLISRAFMHPSRPLITLQDTFWFGFALTGALLAGAWLVRRRLRGTPTPRELLSGDHRAAWVLGLSGLLVLATIMSVQNLRGWPVTLDARYHRVNALVLLPLFVAWGAHAWRSGDGVVRALCAGAGALFIAFPALYGGATLADKALVRSPREASTVGADGLRRELLGSDTDSRAFYAEVEQLAGAGAAPILYITSPDLALPLIHHRLIVRHADFTELEELRRDVYQGRPAGPILLLLPRSFDTNTRGDVVKRSFRDVRAWQEIPLRSTDGWVMWKSVS